MKKVKKFSLIIISAFICIFSAAIFTGCKHEKTYSDLFVFAKQGGYVQVGDSEDVVEFGDEGSKLFTLEKGEKIDLKAVANTGYQFVKWEVTTENDIVTENWKTNPEITLKLKSDKIVISAVFSLSGDIVTYQINYPNDMQNYQIVPETGYLPTVVEGGDFKFKVNLDAGYSNSYITVKANNNIIKCNPQGIYSITNIRENILLSVEGVVANTIEYEIYVPAAANFNIVPVSHNSCIVNQGSSFVFEIQPNPGYKLADTIIVKANNNILAENNGEYTIDSVNSDIEITVYGVEAIEQFTVSLPTSSDYQIVDINNNIFNSNEIMVTEGETFRFKVGLLIDAQEVESIVVKANGTVLNSDANGIYSIDVISIQTIEVVINKKQESINYQFNLSFESDIEDLLGDTSDVPTRIGFDSTQKGVTKANMFVVTTNISTPLMTMTELVNLIEEYLLNGSGLGIDSGVKCFMLNNQEFITINKGTQDITINWELLETTDNRNLTIIIND